MAQENVATDALFNEYTRARHIYALEGKHAVETGQDTSKGRIEAMEKAFDLEDDLEERGVSVEKLRGFWSAYAEANGLEA